MAMFETIFGNPWVRALLALAAIIGLCLLAYALSFVLIPLLLAFIVAYILDPVLDWLETHKVSRGVGIGALAGLGVIILISIPIYAYPSMIRQAKELVASAQKSGVDAGDQAEDGFFESAIRRGIEWLPLDTLVDELGWRKEYILETQGIPEYEAQAPIAPAQELDESPEPAAAEESSAEQDDPVDVTEQVAVDALRILTEEPEEGEKKPILEEALVEAAIQHEAGLSVFWTQDLAESPKPALIELDDELVLVVEAEEGPLEAFSITSLGIGDRIDGIQSRWTGERAFIVQPTAQETPASVVIAHRLSRMLDEQLRELLTQDFGTFASAGRTTGQGIAAVFTSIGRSTMSFITFIVNLAIFGFVAGYLLLDYDGVVGTMKSLVPPRFRPTVFRIAGKIDDQMRSFLAGQGTVCLFLALMYAVGLLIAQTPFAIPIAVFGGIAALIPVFGVWLTFIPAAVLTLIMHGLSWNIVAVVLTFAIVQALEGNVVTPMVMGNRVGLHPVWVMLAIMVFGSLMGFTGLLIAVPLSAIIKVFVVEGLDYYRSLPIMREAAAEGPEEEEGGP